MKLTDFALIFLGIVLPLILIVFVNITFTIMASEQEIYYQSLIDSAVKDAAYKMKQVENEDNQIDYGYSGLIEGKVSVNANIAFDSFFDSLANNLNLNDNERNRIIFKILYSSICSNRL